MDTRNAPIGAYELVVFDWDGTILARSSVSTGAPGSPSPHRGSSLRSTRPFSTPTSRSIGPARAKWRFFPASAF